MAEPIEPLENFYEGTELTAMITFIFPTPLFQFTSGAGFPAKLLNKQVLVCDQLVLYPPMELTVAGVFQPYDVTQAGIIQLLFFINGRMVAGNINVLGLVGGIGIPLTPVGQNHHDIVQVIPENADFDIKFMAPITIPVGSLVFVEGYARFHKFNISVKKFYKDIDLLKFTKQFSGV